MPKAKNGRSIPPLDHLATLSDDVGVIQHALHSVPNRKTGYCTDDVSRAFMVALAYRRLAPNDALAERLASNALAFLQHAQLEDGRFRNFMDYDRRWLEDVGSADSCGRAIWALGYGMANARKADWRSACAILLDRALPAVGTLTHLRSGAYAAIGFALAYAATKDQKYAEALGGPANVLLAAYEANASTDWPWFEQVMTYDNARLPEAMIRAGGALADRRYHDIGLQTLAFYERVTTENGVHVPIGNDGWYRRGGPRARYAQQPLEACAMVDAQLAAFDATGDVAHFASAELALEWYYGKNSRGIEMAQGGGCYDGLDEQSVNLNMGAESTLALLSAAYSVAVRRSRVLRAVR